MVLSLQLLARASHRSSKKTIKSETAVLDYRCENVTRQENNQIHTDNNNVRSVEEEFDRVPLTLSKREQEEEGKAEKLISKHNRLSFH